MSGIEVVPTEVGIPLVRLTGPLTGDGAALADQIMTAIHYRTEDPDFPHPLSLRQACVRAPQSWTSPEQ